LFILVVYLQNGSRRKSIRIKTGIVVTSQQHERWNLNQGVIVIEHSTSHWDDILAFVIGLGIWLGTLCTVGLFYGLMYRLKLTWLVMPVKMFSLFLGWAIVSSAGGIIETFNHSGGGMITESEGGDREGNGGYDREVWADESEYKREKFAIYGMFFGIALFVWVCIAKQEHDEKIEEEYKIARCSAAHAAAMETVSPVNFRMWREERKRKEN